MYLDNSEGTQVILGSMNMGYISNTARNWTHNLFLPKCERIPVDLDSSKFVILGHQALTAKDKLAKKYSQLNWTPLPIKQSLYKLLECLTIHYGFRHLAEFTYIHLYTRHFPLRQQAFSDTSSFKNHLL